MGVAGDQADASHAAGDQVGEELVPRSSGLAGRDAHAEDFAVPVATDPGRQEHHGVDHASTFADLHRERVSRDERERPGGVEGTVAELLDVLVELGSHP